MLVLYRVVRRLAGPLAGLTASVVLAASPATMTLDRGNIPDSLMILLLVLAADSTVSAVLTGRWRSVVMVGVWVGLGFQAKMLEVWLVLPALGLTYLVAARGATRARPRPSRRHRRRDRGPLALVHDLRRSDAGVATALRGRQHEQLGVPAGLRLQRLLSGRPGVAQRGARPFARDPPVLPGRAHPGVDRLLTRSYGRDTGWLLPAAVIAAAGILAARRGSRATDLPRPCAAVGDLALVLVVVSTVSTTWTRTTRRAVARGGGTPRDRDRVGLGAPRGGLGRGGGGGHRARHRGLRRLAPAHQGHGPPHRARHSGRCARPGRGTGPRVERVVSEATDGTGTGTGSGGSGRPGGSRAPPRAGCRQRLGGGRGARSLRHAVPVGRRDKVRPHRVRPAALAARPGRHRGGTSRCAIPDGGPDIGRWPCPSFTPPARRCSHSVGTPARFLRRPPSPPGP